MNNTILLCTLMITLCIASQSYTPPPVPFPQTVITAMATRQMRYHHFLWHNIRNLWNALDYDTQQAITALNWAPPRPALNYSFSGAATAIEDNNSGEDFLYMHQQLINTVNRIITATKSPYGNVTGWTSIPVANDTLYPMPPAYKAGTSTSLNNQIAYTKSDSLYNTIKSLETNFKDPVKLRNMTLGELGSRIEFTVHNWLHIRYSNVSSVGYRPDASSVVPNVSVKWDNASYNWMGDTYSAHVNPIFWKLHGWVNDRIEDWRKAHGLKTITWQGKWLGGPISEVPNLEQATAGGRLLVEGAKSSNDTCVDEDAGMGNMNMEVMEKVMDLLMKCGAVETHFYNNITSSCVPEQGQPIEQVVVQKKYEAFRSGSTTKNKTT